MSKQMVAKAKDRKYNKHWLTAVVLAVSLGGLNSGLGAFTLAYHEIEAESGTVSGAMIVVDDGSVSGGQYVIYEESSAPTPIRPHGARASAPTTSAGSTLPTSVISPSTAWRPTRPMANSSTGTMG